MQVSTSCSGRRCGRVVEHVAGGDQRRAAGVGELGQRLDARAVVAAIEMLRGKITRARDGSSQPLEKSRELPVDPLRRQDDQNLAFGMGEHILAATAGRRPSGPAAARARSAATAGRTPPGRSESRAENSRSRHHLRLFWRRSGAGHQDHDRRRFPFPALHLADHTRASGSPTRGSEELRSRRAPGARQAMWMV